jgi:glycosidase
VAGAGAGTRQYPAMGQDIAAHLAFLYGRERARELEPRLRRLLGEHAGRPGGGGRRRTPTERDVILITYGDQVRRPGEPPLRTLAAFLEDHLEGVVSGVHLLPFFPSSSDDGFAVIDYREVDPALGAWDDVERIGRRFDLMVDAVFNHVSARSRWFQGFLAGEPRYRDWFIVVDGDPDLSQVVRPRALPLLTRFDTALGPRRVWTTFSPDQVDLDVRNPEVLLALIEVLLFYVARGAKLIRLDAIAYLWKEIGTPCIHLPRTHGVVRLLRSVLDEVAAHVLLVTETNVPHLDNVSYFGDGTDEAQLVYNFALPPLLLHALATGDARHLSRWAASLRVPPGGATFLNFLASHDGIGLNPVRGLLDEEEIEALCRRALAHGGFVSDKDDGRGSRSPYELNVNYFDALSDPGAAEPLRTQIDRFLAAHAVMLSLAGVPALYFHSLFGSRGDRAGAEASGIPRRINRQKLVLEDLERELAHPGSLRSMVLKGLADLLARRRASAAFHPAGGQRVLDLDPRVFALVRTSPDGRESVLCLHNLSPEWVAVRVPPGEVRIGCGAELVLGPYQVRWAGSTGEGGRPAPAGGR